MTSHAPSPTPPHWNERPKASSEVNNRSVTPAMNNTRSAAYSSRASSPGNGYGSRTGTPTRYYGAYNSSPARSSDPEVEEDHQPPASTGLIRLTLRKPMGIVFEPMYDQLNASIQRGVRICDLPRTGAAALSRKLEIGDELLSINDKTMSRLTFDEIMDFIIEADPDKVHLLFRRPRRETIAARATPPVPTPNAASVKWVDDKERKSKDKKSKSNKKSRAAKRDKVSEDEEEDDTIQSVNEDSTLEDTPRRKSRGRRGDPYQSESFLDMLIETICANPDVCKDNDRRRDDEYYSDDETFNSIDDSTYITYESERPPPKSDRRRSKGQAQRRDDRSSTSETAEDTLDERERDRKGRHARAATTRDSRAEEKAALPRKPYADDFTLETAEQSERLKKNSNRHAASPPPLGLAPEAMLPQMDGPAKVPPSEHEPNAAPIAEVEYDERFNADVSVMESLGGPSLLIEKQRQSAAAKGEEPIPSEIVKSFGLDFPADVGLTREQTAQRHPGKFYSHVVRGLLQENEPEKVRLLDKLLAKYKGREDHLVQKLNVRYNKSEDLKTPTIPEEEDNAHFASNVNQSKDSAVAAAVVETAKDAFTTAWPAKGDHEEGNAASEISESGSEYSGDSIDGTSPAVIAQVSELLNYVYGKTSVPGQIDRVSTIMRAYEGREAVLLELLETKALIKANGEKENAANLPSFLRNSPALQSNAAEGEVGLKEDSNVSTANEPIDGLINDDVSSMSGVSSPAEEDGGKEVEYTPTKKADSSAIAPVGKSAASSKAIKAKPANGRIPAESDKKQKKKGIFKGLFGGKKKGKDTGGAKKGRKLKPGGSGEGSI